MLMPYYTLPLALALLDAAAAVAIHRLDDLEDEAGLRARPRRARPSPEALGWPAENGTEPDVAARKPRNGTRKGLQGNGTKARNGTRERNNSRLWLQRNDSQLNLDREYYQANRTAVKAQAAMAKAEAAMVKAEAAKADAKAKAEADADLKNQTKNRGQQSSETRFPTQLGTMLFVAGAHRISHVAGMSFHVFDIGFYLDQRSSLWLRRPSVEDILLQAPGSCLLRLEIASGMVTGKRLANSINNIIKKHLTDRTAERAMDVFVSMVQGGPALHIGSVVDIHIRPTGLKIEVDGVDLGGEVKHSSVAKAMLTTYLDDAPDIPVFKDAILSNLGQGIKKYAFRGVGPIDSDGLGSGGVPMVRTMILVIVPCVVGIAIFYWCIFRRPSVLADTGRSGAADRKQTPGEAAEAQPSGAGSSKPGPPKLQQ